MNKNIKTIFMLTTLLIILITIGSVAATDNITTSTGPDTISTQTDNVQTQNIETKTITKTDNKDIKTASNYTITESTYSKYFDADSTIKKDAVQENSNIQLSGNFKNKDFVFDNIKLTVSNDGTAKLYNTSIITQNGAQITFNNLIIENINKGPAITLNSEQNTIQNTQITSDNIEPVHVIDVSADNNNIINTTVTAKAPSSDVNYDAQYVGHPQTSGIYVSSNNNILDEVTVDFDGTEQVGYFPSVDGIDIQSPGADTVIKNNQILNSQVTVTGSNYVYGINVGRAKDTIIDNINVNTQSTYYADSIQLFDAEGISINGQSTATADEEAYAVYSTAMAIGTSKDIDLTGLNVKVTAHKATGILMEGSSAITIDSADYQINGDNAIAVNGHVDWMGNVPVGLDISNLNININTTGNSNVLYFGLCDDVSITDNTILSVKGSEINFNSTTNGKVTDNYISINNNILGDNAVITTETDTIVKDNNALYTLTDDTYSNFFDEESTAKTNVIKNGTKLLAIGDFKNKDFVFDNIEVSLTTDGTGKFYNTTIISQNNAKVKLDGIIIDNTDKNAIVFESESNTIIDSMIIVNSTVEMRAVEFVGDKNTIINSMIGATIPSADVPYDSNFVGHPISSGLYISSNNNLVEDVIISVDGDEVAEGQYFPNIDGLDIQSKASGTTADNNTIINTKVSVTGSNYAYGINVGRAKNTVLDDIEVEVISGYYDNAVQLFDADTISISGKAHAIADYQAYALYSTAMAVGTSKDIIIQEFDVTVEAPLPTGILLEGAGDATITDSNYEIIGQNATAISAYIDWMGNVPANIEITNNNININTTGDASVLYFGASDNITITDNKIISNKGSEINFNSTTNAKVTDNIIMINDSIFGDDGVKTTETDTIVENNKPTKPISEYIDELLNTIDELTADKESILSIDPIEDAQYGDIITITGKLTDKNGIAIPGVIKLLINNGRATVKANVEGTYTYDYKTTKVGTLDIVATFQQTEEYEEATASTTLEVSPQDTILVINPIESIKTGNDATITGTLLDANLNPVVGSVKLTVNNGRATVKTDENGEFTYTSTLTKAGTNNITASYLGSTKYNPADDTTTVEVSQLETKIILDTINPTKLGDNITIKGTLADENDEAISGTVKLLINNGRATVKTDKNGAFTYTYTTTRVGTNNITATYLGSTKYTESAAATTFEVTKANTKITLNPIKSTKKGNNITITGKLTDSTEKAVTGTIKLLINNGRATVKTDDDGVFTYTYAATKAGTIDITATYLESNKYTESTATTAVEILKQATKIVLNPISTVTQKTNVDITGKLCDENGNGIYGTVKLLINSGRATVKTDDDGVFTYTYNATRAGTNNVTATYIESANYSEGVSTTSFTVAKP